MKVLIVVDMQNDFIDGALGTKEAITIVDHVRGKIDQYLETGYSVIYTRDTHTEEYLQTQEGHNLPVVHCVKGTHGWDISEQVYVEGCTVIDKPAFGSLKLPEVVMHCIEKSERKSTESENGPNALSGGNRVSQDGENREAREGENQDIQVGESKDELEAIELIGLCTDICVISNAIILKAAFPEVPIVVDASCCAGVTPESHENALNAMRMCQIQIL
ncbi:MAG: cysteine hydrolase [Lachnospiraceae bacterium]|nr:cysteine hydrolase [Lachnospiraceae bacterium]